MDRILNDLRAGLMRACMPMQAPRLAGALMTQACAWWAQPLTIASAAISGYAEAHRAVLRVLP